MNFVSRLAGLSIRARLGLAALSGVVGALGLAPFDLWYIALFGFAAHAALLVTATSPKQGGWLAWAGGAGYFMMALHWIVEPFLVDIARHGWMAPFALPLMAGGLALFWALAGWGALRLTGKTDAGRLAGWVLALTLSEYLRATVLTGFPWAHPGHVWISSPVLQYASIVGPHGLNLLTLGTAAFLVALPRGIAKATAWIAGYGLLHAALLVTAVSGSAFSPSHEGAIVRLVQPNAPQHLKWLPEMVPVFFERGLELTAAPPQDPILGPPDLVIWPETSLPTLLRYSGDVRQMMAQAAGGVPILVGGQRYEGRSVRNSLFHLGAEGEVLNTYDKHHLVPFGEYLPLSGLASRLGLSGLAESALAGYTPGPGPQLMEIEGIGSIFPMICYETIFPTYVREVGGRPNLLVQVTNDAWFGNFSGPFQHLALARLRAVEQGIPLVRSANTGVSAMISAHGEVVASLPLNEAGVLDVRVPDRTPSAPLYARYGDWPVLVLLLGVSIGVILADRRMRH